MKVVEIKVLRGPNYWSVRRPKLIQMKLDLELSMPPVGIAVRQTRAQKEKMLADFAAD